MNKILLSLVILFSFSVMLAQDVQEDEEHYGCSHKGLYNKLMGGKSVINPNPYMFNYDVKFYKLDIEAYDTTDQFSGYAIVVGEVIDNPLDTFSIELHNKLAVDSAFIDGVKYIFDHSSNNITVIPAAPIPVGSLFEFKLFYHTPVGYSSTYYSSKQNPSYGDFYVSQSFSEPYSAHEWMPCKQELEDKADSVHIFITTDSSLMAAGPGLLTEVLLPDGKVRYEWRCHIPAAYYLIAFAVSDYQDYSIYAKPDSLVGDSILIQSLVYDYPGCLESNKANLDNTPQMIEILSNLYGLYPFYQEKYGHYMWYPSSFSGMEHITMSGMRYFNTYLISHELGHSWWGDNVTCATWSDIWINEGFATYTQYLILEYMFSKASADAQMATHMNFVMSATDGSVYVPAEDLGNVGRIFSNRLSYKKGGNLVHMIRFEMNNDSLFFRTLYKFQQQYKDSIATGLDFKNVCEEISGLDFTDFFDQWYFGEGWPIYGLTWSQDNDTISLDVTQSTSTPITPLYKMPMEYKITFTGGDTTFRVYQTNNDTTYKFILPFEVYEIEIDPNNWVLNGVDTVIHRKNLDLKVFLEGAYDLQSNLMKTDLNPEFLPLTQPYNQPPWSYSGTESTSLLPENAVDWLLIELYDTLDVSLVSSSSLIDRHALFVLDDGHLVNAEGDYVQFNNPINQQLFVILKHRNHLGILSAFPLLYDKGIYEYDFSIGESRVVGGSDNYTELETGIWGMMAGDANVDGTINDDDKIITWENSAGESGYLSSDLNLDAEANNLDKDDYWLPNLGKSSQIPY